MMKFLSAVLLAGAVALVGASAAQATHEPGHTYPAVATATVSDPVVTVGEPFVFSGTGMLPGETVNIVASNETPAAAGLPVGQGRLGAAQGVIVLSAVVTTSTTADANGNFAVTMSLPEPGTYTLTATGAQSGVQVSAVITVVAAAIEAAALPETGADSRLLIWGAAGAGALALGAATVVIARRRNS